MTQEQMQITMAYTKLANQLKDQYDKYMEECISQPDVYDGIREDDAYLWFVESL